MKRRLSKKNRIARARYARERGNWKFEDPQFPRDDWKFEVRDNSTQLGYFDWIIHKLES